MVVESLTGYVDVESRRRNDVVEEKGGMLCVLNQCFDLNERHMG